MSRPGRTSGWWAAGFLAVTAGAVGLEVWAAADGDDRTSPWTHLLVDFVPAPLTLAAAAVLAVWLPVHLVRAYRRRREPESD